MTEEERDGLGAALDVFRQPFLFCGGFTQTFRHLHTYCRGLLDALDRCLPDPRDPLRTTHPQRALLAPRVFGRACGYEDRNDHDTLRHDPLWQALADYDPDPDQPLASSPTLCRLENRVDRAALVRLSAALVDTFLASFARIRRPARSSDLWKTTFAGLVTV